MCSTKFATAMAFCSFQRMSSASSPTDSPSSTAAAPAAARLAGRDVLAFAGIGRPEKFFATLEALGARVVERAPFADHHPYRPAEVAALIDRAAAAGALPVTTAKDVVRLPPELRGRVDVLPVSVRWEDEGALAALLYPMLLKGSPDGQAA